MGQRGSETHPPPSTPPAFYPYTQDHDSHESTSIDGIFKAHLKSNREHSDYWDDSDGFIDDETFEEREDSGPSSLGVLCAPDLSGKTVALEKMQNVEVTLKSGTPYYAVIEELDEIKGAALVKYIDGSFETAWVLPESRS